MKQRPLVALSSAAIVAIYTAGYIRTRAAAERFNTPATPRRSIAPDAPKVEARLAIPATSEPLALVTRPSPALMPSLAAPTTTPSAEPDRAAPSPEAPAAPPSDVPSAIGFDDQSVQGVERPTVDAPPPEPVIARGQYQDGTYLGWGSCRHGDIQASVVVEAGRVVSAKVAQCRTRYACNWIDPLLPQVVARQNAEVDWVSGATESSDAFHDAVAEALSKAK